MQFAQLTANLVSTQPREKKVVGFIVSLHFTSLLPCFPPAVIIIQMFLQNPEGTDSV